METHHKTFAINRLRPDRSTRSGRSKGFPGLAAKG